MGKLKFTFPNIFLWVGIVASMLLIENIGFLTTSGNGPLSNKYFFMLAIVALLSYVAMFFFEHKMNKTKIDVVLLIVLGGLLAGGLVAIWTYRDMSFTYLDSSVHTVSYTTMEKVRFSIAFSLFIISAYAILFIFTKNTVTPRKMLWIYVILMIVVFASIAYSLIFEMEKYRLFFSPDYTEKIAIQSFFWNTNMYSGFLLMGLCATMIINIYWKNPFNVIAIIVFSIEVLVVHSYLSIITVLFVVPIYFLFEIILAYKKKPVQSFIMLFILLASIVSLICLFAVALNKELGFLSVFAKKIYSELSNLRFDTLSDRTRTWNGTFEMLTNDPMKLFFGFGFGINAEVMRTWSISIRNYSIISTHNGILQIFFNYGLVGLVIYCLFLIYFIYAIIRLFKNDKSFALTFLLVGITMLGYSVGESVIYFNSNAQGFIVGILFYLPVMMKHKHERKKSIITSIKSQPYSWTTMEDSLVVKTAAIIIVSIGCAFIPFLFMDSVKGMGFVYRAIITGELCLAVLWLTFPYLLYLWHNNTALIHFRIRAIFNMIIIAALMGGVALGYYLFYRVSEGTHMYVFPIALASIMLIEIIYYSIIKKPSFKAFLSTFVAIFKTSVVGAVTSLATMLTLVYFFQGVLERGLLKYIIIGAFNLLMFYVFSMAIMFKDMRDIWSYIDRVQINSIHRAVLKDEGAKNSGKEN